MRKEALSELQIQVTVSRGSEKAETGLGAGGLRQKETRQWDSEEGWMDLNSATQEVVRWALGASFPLRQRPAHGSPFSTASHLFPSVGAFPPRK